MRTALFAAAAALAFSSLARADESLLNCDPFAAEGALHQKAALKAAFHGDNTELKAERQRTGMGRQENRSVHERTQSNNHVMQSRSRR